MPNLFVYCPHLSSGATDLANALGATRLRNFDGLNFWRHGSIVEIPTDSIIVNWGGKLPILDDIRVLNHNTDYTTQYSTLMQWRNVGVRTLAIWLGASNPNRYGGGSWMPRRFDHHNCQDLLRPPTGNPSYWMQRLTITKEYRLHVFNNRIIRSGAKVLRPSFALATSDDEWLTQHTTEHIAHPWWRHFETGWTVDYNEVPADPNVRKLAIKAVQALSLTFGVVDIGVNPDGGYHWAIGINMTPPLDDVTLPQYAKLIQKWIVTPPKLKGTTPEIGDHDEVEPPPTGPWIAPFVIEPVGEGPFIYHRVPHPPVPRPPRWQAAPAVRPNAGNMAELERLLGMPPAPPEIFYEPPVEEPDDEPDDEDLGDEE